MTVGPDGTGTNETSVVLSLAFVVLGATKLPVVPTRRAPSSERETAPKATPAAPMARAAAIAATTVRRRGFVTDPRVPRLRRLHKDGSGGVTPDMPTRKRRPKKGRLLHGCRWLTG